MSFHNKSFERGSLADSITVLPVILGKTSNVNVVQVQGTYFIIILLFYKEHFFTDFDLTMKMFYLSSSMKST